MRRQFIAAAMTTLLSLGLLVSVGTGSFASTMSSNAFSMKTGVIVGQAMECGQGPVAITRGKPGPKPLPEAVILFHNNRTFGTQNIVFSLSTPWIGAFSFSVPIGKYEVLYTYQGAVHWVNVKAKSRNTVSFDKVACAN